MYNKPWVEYVESIGESNMKYDLALFPERLKMILRCKGISQGKFADTIKINRATFSQMLNSSRYINMNTMICIANELNVPIDFLAGDKRYESDFNFVYDRVTGTKSWTLVS